MLAQRALLFFAFITCWIEIHGQNYVHEAQKYYRKIQAFHNAQWDPNQIAETLGNLDDDQRENALEILDRDSPDILANFTSIQCGNDTVQFIKDLFQVRNYTYTIKVLDSWGKPPAGILQGNFLWWGNYDECVRSRRPPDHTSPGFSGKYCTTINNASALFNFPSASSGGIPPGTDIDVHYGICVPDSCDQEDVGEFIATVETYLEEYIQDISYLFSLFEYLGSSCASARDYTGADYACIVIITVILTITTIGTIYDVVQRMLSGQSAQPSSAQPDDTSSTIDSNSLMSNDVLQNNHANGDAYTIKAPSNEQQPGTVGRVLLCFSVVTNGGKLLNPTMRFDNLGAINGIRVFSMWWVILGHTYVFTITNFTNLVDMIPVESRFSFQAVGNAFFSVDSFFFLSGFLLTYLTLKELENKAGKLNWAMYYFHRFWRLTPVYMFTILFFSSLFLHLPSGPGMRADDSQSTTCGKYWWANLLYINNFVPNGNSPNEAGGCMGWAWYLANDMQFFWISPPILYLLYRYWPAGVGLCTAWLVACMGATGGVSSRDHLSSSVLTSNMSGWLLYIRPYHRINPYIIGILGGFVLHRTRRGLGNFMSVKAIRVFIAVGWVVATGLGISVVYGLYPQYHGTIFSNDINALYNATSRMVWGIALCWMTLACLWGYGGPVNSLLSWSVWSPLGRLTYCAYMVHPMVMYYVYNCTRTPIYYTDVTIIYFYIGHIVLSYMVAFVLSVTVEAPMMGLEKIIFKRGGSNQKPKRLVNYSSEA